MNREEILNAIRSLAMSQGYYGRLMCRIEYLQEEDPSQYEYLMEALENEHFEDTVDLVMFLEG